MGKRQRLRTDSSVRLFGLKTVLAGGWLAGFLLSYKLWLSDRSYPLCPITPLLPTVPDPFDRIWFGLLLALLGAVLVLPRPRRCLLLLVALAILLSLWDQMRWQPWFYQYVCMGAVLGTLAWRADGARSDEAALDACRLLVASIYFWSGLHKLNATFVRITFPWLVQPLLPWPAESVPGLLAVGGLAASFIEAGLGLGLLFPRLRRPAVVAAGLMHGFILLAIGPWGHHQNSVVWPWNVAMVLFVVILFWRTDDVSWRALLVPGGRVGQWVVLALFGVMPFFNFLDLWDSYLSANLYSGNVLHGIVYIKDDVRQRLPEDVQPYVRPTQNGHQVDVEMWAMGELNVPPNPERRVYRNTARHLCSYARGTDDVILVTVERPLPWSVKRTKTTYRCSQLQ